MPFVRSGGARARPLPSLKHDDKMKTQDVLRPLPAGAMKFGGFLGDRLALCMKRRLEKIRWKHLTEPFFGRSEDDGRWRCEFWGITFANLSVFLALLNVILLSLLFILREVKI